jgi:hypothetical protein
MLAGLTSTTAWLPSASERAVVTARPSFQNRRMMAPMISTMPISTPRIDLPRRAIHDVDVTWVNVSPGSDIHPPKCSQRPM